MSKFNITTTASQSTVKKMIIQKIKIIHRSKDDFTYALTPVLCVFDGEKRIQCAHSIRTNSVHTFTYDIIRIQSERGLTIIK